MERRPAGRRLPLQPRLSKWIYSGDETKGRPADLGYFIGRLVILSRADGEESRRRRPQPQAPVFAF
jgi:hypothetical protein